MAFTRVRGPGITTDDNYRVGILTATKFVGPMQASGDRSEGKLSIYSYYDGDDSPIKTYVYFPE